MDETRQFDIADLARMAAFLDGEGTIRLKSYKQKHRSGNRTLRHEIKLSITNTDIRLPLWCKETFKCGCVYISDSRVRHTGQKCAHRWETGSKSAAMVLRAVEPYLILKKEQAEICLAFQNLITNRMARSDDNKYAATPKENSDQRLLLVQKVTALNRRGA